MFRTAFLAIAGAFLLATACAPERNAPKARQDQPIPNMESASGQLEDSPRHLEWVQIPAGDRTVHAFVAYPEVSEKAPVVIVVHEIFGMTEWVQTVADKLAANGYIAIAPDLLSGMGPDGGRTSSFEGTGSIREAVSSLPDEQVNSDLNAVSEYAKGLPASNGTVAIAGFCWGGSTTFRYATVNPDLSAAFVFYGSAPDDPAAISKIGAPVYGFYGENDARINATIPQTEEMMSEAGKTYKPVIYDGAGHGFMRAGAGSDASAENAAAHEAAWERWLELLGKPESAGTK